MSLDDAEDNRNRAIFSNASISYLCLFVFATLSSSFHELLFVFVGFALETSTLSTIINEVILN